MSTAEYVESSLMYITPWPLPTPRQEFVMVNLLTAFPKKAACANRTKQDERIKVSLYALRNVLHTVNSTVLSTTTLAAMTIDLMFANTTALTSR